MYAYLLMLALGSDEYQAHRDSVNQTSAIEALTAAIRGPRHAAPRQLTPLEVACNKQFPTNLRANMRCTMAGQKALRAQMAADMAANR